MIFGWKLLHHMPKKDGIPNICYQLSSSTYNHVLPYLSRLGSIIECVAKRERGSSTNYRLSGNDISIQNGVDGDSWWVGRVHALWRCNGKQFDVLKQSVDNVTATKESRKRNHNNPHTDLMLQYCRKHLGRSKFKYDHTYGKRMHVDCVISIVTMSYQFTNDVYTLDRNDAK